MLMFRSVRILSLVTVAAALGNLPATSASTFDGIGAHTLTSSDVGITAAALATTVTCSRAVFEVFVASPFDARVTAATVDDCTSAGALLTITATNLPWTIIPVGDGLTIDGIHLVSHFTSGNAWTFSGNLAGATVNNATHTATWNNATGLVLTVLTGGTVDSATASTTIGGTFTGRPGQAGHNYLARNNRWRACPQSRTARTVTAT